MPIVYVAFEVSVSGLSLQTEQEMVDLQQRIASAVKEHVPLTFANGLGLDANVQVEIIEHAGTAAAVPAK